jgi:hypothetical protein
MEFRAEPGIAEKTCRLLQSPVSSAFEATTCVTRETAEFPYNRQPQGAMRTREHILSNLESIYRESYDRAKQASDHGRMVELDSAYMRDQLMLEILLDIRDLFSVAPAASGGTALERLEALRRLTKLP